MRVNVVDYNLLFSKFEDSIKNNLFINESKFTKRIKPFLEMDFRKQSDKEIFWILVYVIFYSGIKAVIIEKKLESIKKELYDFEIISELNDEEKEKIISKLGFPKKCNYCFSNSLNYKEIIEEFGSFNRYVTSFGITDLHPHNSKMNLLKEDLKKRFNGLGPRTVNHFLTDLGFDVLKPDRVICRIFYRLGLIDSPQSIEDAIIEGKKFKQKTGKPIRYIDIIFVKYGQMGKSDYFGTKDGICLENKPNCVICEAKEFCKYFKEKTESTSFHL
jgi:DNA-3-methyladenine glycosylase I